MVNLQRIRTFVTVCECGSLASAANRLNLTQSAISIQISHLEQDLGVRLFDRSRRPIRLTHAGRRLATRTVNAITRLDADIAELSQTGSNLQHVRVGAIPTILSNLLPVALVRLRNEHPELTINVSSGLSGRLLKQVRQGDLDAAIIHEPARLGAEYSWSDISRQAILVVAPPITVETKPVELFSKHSYIRFHNRAWVAPMIEQRFSDLRIKPRTIAEIESIEAIFELVRVGVGASVLPVKETGGFVPKGVRLLEFGQPALYRKIGIVTRANSGASLLHQVMKDAFAEL